MMVHFQNASAKAREKHQFDNWYFSCVIFFKGMYSNHISNCKIIVWEDLKHDKILWNEDSNTRKTNLEIQDVNCQ